MGKHDATNIATAKQAHAAGWPELTGTEAQIPWGITERANKMREFEAVELPAAKKDRWREALLREHSAGVWIDLRRDPWPVLALRHLTDAERTDLTGQ